MFKAIFLQLGGEQEAYDVMMDIGSFFEGFHQGLVEFASSIFGAFGL